MLKWPVRPRATAFSTRSTIRQQRMDLSNGYSDTLQPVISSYKARIISTYTTADKIRLQQSCHALCNCHPRVVDSQKNIITSKCSSLSDGKISIEQTVFKEKRLKPEGTR